jgi:hypothetical protein
MERNEERMRGGAEGKTDKEKKKHQLQNIFTTEDTEGHGGNAKHIR